MGSVIPTESPLHKMPLYVDIVLPSASIELIEVGGERKILRFKAPNGFAVSIPLDEIGVENLVQALKGTKLSIARL